MRRKWHAKDPPKYHEVLLYEMSLAALLKIKKRVDEIESKQKQYEIEKPAYDRLITSHKAQLEAKLRPFQEKEQILHERIRSLWQKVNPYRHDKRVLDRHKNHGMLGLLFDIVAIKAINAVDELRPPKAGYIDYRGMKFDGCVKAELEKLSHLEIESSKIADQKRQIQENLKLDASEPPRPPARIFRISDQSKTYSVDVDRLDCALLADRIEEERKINLAQKEAQLEIHQEIKAKAKAYDDKQRDLAKSVRNRIKRQLHEYPDCPYCGASLSIFEAHADHIHPVALGGLSTSWNMVFVCADCNTKKKARTLREFIRDFDLDEQAVHRNLEKLKKRF